MAAGYQDQYLEQGTTFNSQVTLTDSNGVPYNLNNFTFASQAKRSYYSSNATIIFQVSAADANSGILSISANSAVTSNVPAGKLVYDVIIKEIGSNTVTRILEGQIFVSPAVTRS
jgi:hypothetical protein